MRVIGRYFSIGATLGSVSGLVMLVLVWTWMTVHLGLLGFLVGWIPAGLAAAALWLAMVVFWGPILIVGAMISAALLVLRAHPGRDWSIHEPPAASEADDRSTGGASPREADPAIPREAQSEPPATAAPQPPLGPLENQAATAVPPASPAAPAAPAPNTRQPEDLGGDAAAAGDTSRKPRR